MPRRFAIGVAAALAATSCGGGDDGGSAFPAGEPRSSLDPTDPIEIPESTAVEDDETLPETDVLTERWRVQVPESVEELVIHGDVLVAQMTEGEGSAVLAAYDLETGEERWRFGPEEAGRELHGEEGSPPAVTDTHVYQSTGDGVLVVDLARGTAVAGTAGTEPLPLGLVEVGASDAIVVSSAGGRVVALDAETFDEVWAHADSEHRDFDSPGPVPPAVGGRPILADDVVIVASDLGVDNPQAGLTALDAASGEVVWHQRGMETASHPVLVDDLVVARPTETSVVAFDAATGAERWRVDAGDMTGGSYDLAPPVAADGWVILSQSTAYRVLDVASGETVVDLELPNVSGPVEIVGGNLVAPMQDRCEDGRDRCVGVFSLADGTDLGNLRFPPLEGIDDGYADVQAVAAQDDLLAVGRGGLEWLGPGGGGEIAVFDG